VRFDVVGELLRNDTFLVENAHLWGEVLGFETGAEWLLRWSQEFASKLKLTYATSDVLGVVVADPSTQLGALQSYRQHQLVPELELRYLLQGNEGSLFLMQRDRLFYLFGAGEGAAQSWGFEVSLGAIWRLGDNIYLDADIAYRQTECLIDDCSSAREIRPRLLLSAKL
jgi:hypothetical protein